MLGATLLARQISIGTGMVGNLEVNGLWTEPDDVTESVGKYTTASLSDMMIVTPPLRELELTSH